MSHYARINPLNWRVEQVIVAEEDYINSRHDSDLWIQTSYNTRGGVYYDPETRQPSEDQSKALRKNFAGVGGYYVPELDAFVKPKPFPSWILNKDTCFWEAPVSKPDLENNYSWDEDNQQWVEDTE
jgi:hypothetical protein